ncbi:unnamed protein product [Effrenium voratum]|nr:unnamed protein product [Effrenium voratum]
MDASELPWHGNAFPVDLSQYRQVAIDPWQTETLSAQDSAALSANIELCRDALVCFTSLGGASGYGGHTGGAFDMMPEVCLLDAFFRACPDKFGEGDLSDGCRKVPTFFDEAGHRVATQYLFSVLHGHMPAARLLDYRVGGKALPGHPELGLTEGIGFSSGRLGHMWGHVNGVSRAQPGRVSCCFSSDGSQMEGNTAEAARLAVAQNLPVKLFIDDNDVTIAGHPSSYMKGFNVGRTLEGQGMTTEDVDGESLEKLYAAMRRAVMHEGPYAVVIKRKMCPGVRDLEGSNEGHDAMPLAHAVQYLESRQLHAAVELLKKVPKAKDPGHYPLAGSFGAPRQVFGDAVASILTKMCPEERKRRVLVVDSDLEGSCGLKKVGQTCPEVYLKGGIMERGNFSACAGFGTEGRQAVFGTFAAFQEMILSEVTMARLNHSNVLCHFSHSGVDDMSDNTCHFGVNNFFSDSGLDAHDTKGHATHLFFPADVRQTAKVVDKIFWMQGLRFIYTTRSKVPEILDEEGKPVFGEDYTFELGKDDLILGGACDGYVVSYGDALYRAMDAVGRLRRAGLKVGLVNKCHGNAVDEEMMQRLCHAKFVLVAESQNVRTGLGLRMGCWLLERGFGGRFGRCGTHREGCGGTWEQAHHQGYDPASVVTKILDLAHAAGIGNHSQFMVEGHKHRAIARPLGAGWASETAETVKVAS